MVALARRAVWCIGGNNPGSATWHTEVIDQLHHCPHGGPPALPKESPRVAMNDFPKERLPGLRIIPVQAKPQWLLYISMK